MKHPHKLKSRLNSPVLTLAVFTGFAWLSFYSLRHEETIAEFSGRKIEEYDEAQMPLPEESAQFLDMYPERDGPDIYKLPSGAYYVVEPKAKPVVLVAKNGDRR